MTKDLTTGSVIKNIILFAIPLGLGGLIQQLYSLIDTMIVGQVLGEYPLAGVGATSSLSFMVVYFAMGLCNGFGIPIAQRFGAKDERALRKYLANSIWLCIVLGVIITVAVFVFARQFLVWLRTPDEVFIYSYRYIRVIFLGLGCTIFYNMLAALARSLGDSRTPLIALIISSILNIFLDLLFLIPLHMGVQGAALATILSQLVSGLYCLYHARRYYEVLHFLPGEWKADAGYMKELLRMGFPMGLQYSITALGLLILQSAVNDLGTSAVAGLTVGGKLYSILSWPVEAMGQTMASYSGQNYGARKMKRLQQGLRTAILIGTAWTAVAVPLVLVFGNRLALLFLDEPSPEVAQYAVQFALVCSASFCLLTLVNTLRFTIQGLGFSGLAMGAGFMELIARAMVGLFLVPAIGFTGVSMASMIAWGMADIFLVFSYFYCFRRREREIAEIC